jgi:hypothetical protein
MEVAADRADDDLTGVQAHADQDWHAGNATNLLRVLFHGLLESQRRVARADRMILMGERRAEKRHDAVAHHLIHRALVAVNRFHHPFENRIQEPARLVRVALGEQLHRAFHVGEEDGHLLALAFDRRARGEDSLGEMLRRIRLGKGGEPSGRASDTGRLSARGAKLGTRRELRAATRAAPR